MPDFRYMLRKPTRREEIRERRKEGMKKGRERKRRDRATKQRKSVVLAQLINFQAKQKGSDHWVVFPPLYPTPGSAPASSLALPWALDPQRERDDLDLQSLWSPSSSQTPGLWNKNRHQPASGATWDLPETLLI